jgi:hypothetical protein
LREYPPPEYPCQWQFHWLRARDGIHEVSDLRPPRAAECFRIFTGGGLQLPALSPGAVFFAEPVHV